jgi:hypothetical protein
MYSKKINISDFVDNQHSDSCDPGSLAGKDEDPGMRRRDERKNENNDGQR